MRAPSPTMRARSGFTLVEVLVAIAILAILVTLLGSLFNGAQQSTDLSTRRLTADAQARLVFDRMRNDFNNMLKRPDVDYIFSSTGASGAQNTSGNDAMFFFSDAPGHVDDLSASLSQPPFHDLTSLVGYRIDSNYQLDRLGKNLDWDGQNNGNEIPGGLPFLFFPSGIPNSGSPDSRTTITGIWGNLIGSQANSYADGSDTDYHVLADGVFRMAICFLENETINGATKSAWVYPPLPGTAAANGPPAPPVGAYPLDYMATTSSNTSAHVQVAAVVVALAILDDTSRLILPGDNHPVPATTVTALPDPPISNSTANAPMATSWTTAVTSTGFASLAGLPPKVASQIRVYQRTFYLDLPPTTPIP